MCADVKAKPQPYIWSVNQHELPFWSLIGPKIFRPYKMAYDMVEAKIYFLFFLNRSVLLYNWWYDSKLCKIYRDFIFRSELCTLHIWQTHNNENKVIFKITNKFQLVSTQSNSAPGLLSGKTQGSVLGPNLSLFYINDTLEGIHHETTVRLYAENTIACLTVTNSQDAEELQDFLKLEKWEQKLGNQNSILSYYVCQVLTMTRTKELYTLDYVLMATR